MSFSEYHLKAAPLLQEMLQIEVRGYNTLCSCKFKNMTCEIVFKGKVDGGFRCSEAVIDLSMPGVPKTPQTHKRLVVAIDKDDTISDACVKVVELLTKTAGVKKIVAKQRDVWQVYFADNPAVWASGKTFYEALGDLLFHNPEQFGVEVELLK